MTEIALKGIPENVRKFLMLITFTEGTDRQDTPYNELFGFTNFTGYRKHPNILIKAANYASTAAGRYQILYKTWLLLKAKFPKSDFSPEWQDQFAIELLLEAHAYPHIIAEEWEAAIEKASHIWASLPGSPYGQPTVKLSDALHFLKNI